MPLLLPFRRAGLHERVLQAVLFPLTALLAVGALVPFALMVALSFGDPSDWWSGRKWPDLSHLTNPNRMYVSWLATRYDYWPSMTGFDDLYATTGVDDTTTVLGLDSAPAPTGPWETRAKDGLAFLAQLPWCDVHALFTGWYMYRTQSGHDFAAFTGLSDLAWKAHLRKAYGTIRRVDDKFGMDFDSFENVKVPGVGELNDRMGYIPSDPWSAEYVEFLGRELPADMKMPLLGGHFFKLWLYDLPEIGGDLAKLNALAGTSWAAWHEVSLPESAPPQPGLRRLWETYVRTVASPYLLEIRLAPDRESQYRRFVLGRHAHSEEVVTSLYGVPSGSLRLAAAAADLASATAFADWDAFARSLPADALGTRGGEVLWRRWLKDKYGGLDGINRAHGTTAASLEDVGWPQTDVDRYVYRAHRGRWIAEVVLRNYRRVWVLAAGMTSALWNTARFALLFTLLAVLVNGCAAYVLSRFPFGWLQLTLIGFLALAAFPIEAIAVPNFLLLRHLGLLNTVWALVLPMLINGYYIYLLKAYFDSLPKSYVEEAVLEGAGEWTLFWRVGLPMAGPMLSVVALYAFLWSYANFMWALIVCQRQEEWTLPVLLFNMNTWAAPCTVAAGMVLTILPPLLVFAFAHRTLQRSLSLPRV